MKFSIDCTSIAINQIINQSKDSYKPIKIKKDEWDELWFDYDYYGTDNEIQYSITYKYEVIDSLLHFSNTDGQEFIFHPSKKNYSKDFIDTGKIVVTEGCTFYGLE